MILGILVLIVLFGVLEYIVLEYMFWEIIRIFSFFVLLLDDNLLYWIEF